jgi:hypothetical protein
MGTARTVAQWVLAVDQTEGRQGLVPSVSSGVRGCKQSRNRTCVELLGTRYPT